MTEPEKNVEVIRAGLLNPAFELIKDYIISQGQGDPQIITGKDIVEVLFNDRHGKVCKYKWYVNANGKIYQKVRRPPDTMSDLSGCDASKVTPRRILDDFKAFFRIVI